MRKRANIRPLIYYIPAEASSQTVFGLWCMIWVLCSDLLTAWPINLCSLVFFRVISELKLTMLPRLTPPISLQFLQAATRSLSRGLPDSDKSGRQKTARSSRCVPATVQPVTTRKKLCARDYYLIWHIHSMVQNGWTVPTRADTRTSLSSHRGWSSTQNSGRCDIGLVRIHWLCTHKILILIFYRKATFIAICLTRARLKGLDQASKPSQ